jgi:hypothetical protein
LSGSSFLLCFKCTRHDFKKSTLVGAGAALTLRSTFNKPEILCAGLLLGLMTVINVLGIGPGHRFGALFSASRSWLCLKQAFLFKKKKNSLALLRVLHRNIDKTCFYALEVLDTSFSFFI